MQRKVQRLISLNFFAAVDSTSNSYEILLLKIAAKTSYLRNQNRLRSPQANNNINA